MRAVRSGEPDLCIHCAVRCPTRRSGETKKSSDDVIKLSGDGPGNRPHETETSSRGDETRARPSCGVGRAAAAPAPNWTPDGLLLVDRYLLWWVYAHKLLRRRRARPVAGRDENGADIDG